MGLSQIYGTACLRHPSVFHALKSQKHVHSIHSRKFRKPKSFVRCVLASILVQTHVSNSFSLNIYIRPSSIVERACLYYEFRICLQLSLFKMVKV